MKNIVLAGLWLGHGKPIWDKYFEKVLDQLQGGFTLDHRYYTSSTNFNMSHNTA